MNFDLVQRTAELSVGEFADFAIGPREGGDGPTGLWRAQLGSYWHRELQSQATSDHAGARFEVPINGAVFHRGWTITLTGRIDQIVPDAAGGQLLREIKTVTAALPLAEENLRTDYPSYFAQLSAYVALRRLAAPETPVRAELVFVEADSGLSQNVGLTRTDELLFTARLESVTQFLDLRWRARERLRGLQFRPAFATRRPGQETTEAELSQALQRHRIVAFEAPTGFGKTGVLLEVALAAMREGRFERLVYLTGKSTGQLQVQQTLATMTEPGADLPGGAAASRVAVWQVRNKGEHCVNHTFHCVRDECRFLADLETRWAKSGLARFYLTENEGRDLPALRAAGRDAGICPYEITRVALAFQDVWIGDYNYVFAPRVRGLFANQPGWDPATTLLVIDEAHNLPPRVADAYSASFDAVTAGQVAGDLHRIRAVSGLVTGWDHWTHFLQRLRPNEGLPLADEDDARHLIDEIARHVTQTPLDPAELGPATMEALWRMPSLAEELALPDLPRLWWSARAGELQVTCLDAASVIGSSLRSFGGVVLASATFGPIDAFAASCGVSSPPPTVKSAPTRTAPERLGTLTKKATKQLYRQLASGAELLRVEETRETERLELVTAHTPWRVGAYDVAYDARVDTRYQLRERHHATTAQTVAALQQAAAGPVAVFFPSFSYAEAIVRELTRIGGDAAVALQPRAADLAAQTAWMQEMLSRRAALLLVLGSSFAEGIDLLGGRVSHAMVVGPALPEVNASQRARLAAIMEAGHHREAAVRRVYRIPGIQKVNQALGRLVRAPGHHAKVLLHCQRFLEPEFHQLLATDYQGGTAIHRDDDLRQWLA